MKYIFTVFLILTLSNLSGQKTSICSYYGDNAKHHNSEICGVLSFSSNAEAEKIVDDILSQVGLKRNFIVMECPNIENAMAINIPSDIGMLRYIAYDNEFLESINNSTSTDWASISILAHEVAHHLNGHTLDGVGSNHRTELEADEWSGWVLAKLGATLEQAQSAMNLLALNGDDSYSSHPSKHKRLKAIKKGFVNGGGKIKQKSNATNDNSNENPTTIYSNNPPAKGIPKHKPIGNPSNDSTKEKPITYDTDGDGIEDVIDRCPNEYGTLQMKGCPEKIIGISSVDSEKVSKAMGAIAFKSGTYELQTESFTSLNTIATIMKKYSDFRLVIEGHTDNMGNTRENQLLSEERAKECFFYLIKRGVSPNRMSHTGYGESKPIADNNTAIGRIKNRRVVFNLLPL